MHKTGYQENECQGIAKTLVGGGGRVYSYIHVPHDEFLFKSNPNEFDVRETRHAQHEYIGYESSYTYPMNASPLKSRFLS